MFVAVLSTVLIGFAALAVDVGRLTVATAQCQNAADAAAIAGRELLTAAPLQPRRRTANATTVATGWQILGQFLSPSEVAVQNGAYHYDYPSQTFSPQFPPVRRIITTSLRSRLRIK